MHQARGSQRMTRSFQAQIARRDAPLRVNQRHQLVSRFVVSTAQLFEKRRDVTGATRHVRSFTPAAPVDGMLRA